MIKHVPHMTIIPFSDLLVKLVILKKNVFIAVLLAAGGRADDGKADGGWADGCGSDGGNHGDDVINDSSKKFGKSDESGDNSNVVKDIYV